MYYNDFIRKLRDVALTIPIVRTVVYDIMELDTSHDLKYGVVAIENGISSIDAKGWMTWNGSIYFVDRMHDEYDGNPSQRRDDDALDIQNRGLLVLHTIFKGLNDAGIEGDVSYDFFKHQFLDMCAGVRADVTFRFPLSICWANGFDVDYIDLVSSDNLLLVDANNEILSVYKRN